MTCASGASPTETSFNELESSAHSTTTTVAIVLAPVRRGKRKARTSPSGSRAAHSDVTSQVDSGDDAEEATHRSRFVERPLPPLKRSRGRRLNSSSYAVNFFSTIANFLNEKNRFFFSFFHSSGSESNEVRVGVLSIEESGESQSAAVSLPAPAIRTSSRDVGALRPALARRPRRDDRGLTALDSAEDAEETENRVAAASVNAAHNRDPVHDQSRRSSSHRRRAAAPSTPDVAVPASAVSTGGAALSFEPTFLRPAPRRRRVRIADQTSGGTDPLLFESGRSRLRGPGSSHSGLNKDAIEAFQEHLDAELASTAAAAADTDAAASATTEGAAETTSEA
jgi:hypothetical protein